MAVRFFLICEAMSGGSGYLCFIDTDNYERHTKHIKIENRTHALENAINKAMPSPFDSKSNPSHDHSQYL